MVDSKKGLTRVAQRYLLSESAMLARVDDVNALRATFSSELEHELVSPTTAATGINPYLSTLALFPPPIPGMIALEEERMCLSRVSTLYLHDKNEIQIGQSEEA